MGQRLKEEGARKHCKVKKADEMGDDTKPGMREFFFENLREDARRDGIEKCPQTRDAKTFQ